MVFYTSDVHFGHKAVIYYGNRPYSTVEEMDADIIARWNDKVTDADTVYIVGDVTLKKDPVYISGILSKLRGKKILIKGNHDLFLKDEKCRAYFDKVESLMTIFKEEEPWLKNAQKITLCHFGLVEWPGSRRDPEDPMFGYLIYGHVHSNVQEVYRYLYANEYAYNAGMDVNGLVPVTMEELIKNNEIYRKKAQEILKTYDNKKPF